MRKLLQQIFYFLPVQLLLLQFRKYQLLLVFWIILFATISGNLAAHFGAATLFLAPEYLGSTNFMSMFLLGSCMAVFIMAWQITTFIIHSKRMPFLGATRHAFLIYCINNSVLPILFLTCYSIYTIHFQWLNEHTSPATVWMLQIGFYLGCLFIILLSFLYFFRVGRDLLKVVLSKITNPSRIREIIPYDTLDYEIDMVRADTYISGRLKIKSCADLDPYAPRLMNTVLRRHHRNAIFATIVAFLILIMLGIFMEEPLLRIPAGGGFLFLFAITMGVVGSVKYFLKSWETIGWVLFALTLTLLVKYRFFDLRSIAYGVDYTNATSEPLYKYKDLKQIFSPQRYQSDKAGEELRLDKWNSRQANPNAPLVVIIMSGGGSRASYWTFHALQYMDSVTKGRLFNSTVLMTGASGGMIGGAYWRSLHDAYLQGEILNPYIARYQDNIGKDLLNAIIFSFASVDLISPFNKISIAGYSYTRDRGYALEQELVRNTEGLLDKKIGDFKQREANGSIPQMIINGTIINDGRKLMISAQPIAYLTQPEYALKDTAAPPIDAVDFAEFFAAKNPYNLRLTTALRMTATFPYILPVVRLPSQPPMNIMDAGLRDNFGMEVASRYLHVMRDWIIQNHKDVIFIEIRDTREYSVLPVSDETSLGSMLSEPLFVIQNKWEAFQSYYDSYIKDNTSNFFGDQLHFVTLQYVPQEHTKSAALNFHLTSKEKEDLYMSIYNPENQHEIKTLLQLFH